MADRSPRLTVIEHRRAQRDLLEVQLREQLRLLDDAVASSSPRLEILQATAAVNRLLDQFVQAHR